MTIVTFSRMVGYALEAAKALEKEGISAEVINLRCVRQSVFAFGGCLVFCLGFLGEEGDGGGRASMSALLLTRPLRELTHPLTPTLHPQL